MSDYCHQDVVSRRDFLTKSTMGIGGVALASLLNPGKLMAGNPNPSTGGTLDRLHFAPKAKRVVYLFQSGGPSQLELFDYKPLLNKRVGEELPDSVRGGQRLTGMTSHQKSFR
jgi:hypothetical protein